MLLEYWIEGLVLVDEICQKIYEDLMKNKKIKDKFYGFSLNFNRLGGWEKEIQNACEFLDNISILPDSDTVYKILELRKDLITALNKDGELKEQYKLFQNYLIEQKYTAGCGIPAPLLWVYDFLKNIVRWILNKIKGKKEEKIKNSIDNVTNSTIYVINMGDIKENSNINLIFASFEDILNKKLLKESN